jgi:hypothetical protein
MSPSQPTLGKLYAGDFILHTLEDAWKENARMVSCIPPGTYRVVLAWSDRYQRIMPRLREVPGRDNILIHSGNTHEDTTGCILVGEHRTPNGNLFSSRPAFVRLFRWIAEQVRFEDLYVEVTHGRE